MKKVALGFFFLASAFVTKAQDITAEKIVETYIENIGGREAWDKVEGTEMTAKVNAQGMEIPLTITNLKDGRSAVVVNFQGMIFYQNMFDGDVFWGTNQMTMKAEKGETEATENVKRLVGEFPGELFTYKEMNYTLELDGEATKEGVECYKLKMKKNSQIVEGEEVDNIVYIYMDKESFVPIMQEEEIMSGQMKGQVSQTLLSDYQEVDGLYFPHSIKQQVEGMGGSEIIIESIKLNPEVEDDLFSFPEK